MARTDISEILGREHQLTEELEENIGALNKILNKKKQMLRNLAEAAEMVERGERNIEEGFDSHGQDHIRKSRRLINKVENLTGEYEELTQDEEEIFSKLEDQEKGIETLNKKIEEAEERHL